MDAKHLTLECGWKILWDKKKKKTPNKIYEICTKLLQEATKVNIIFIYWSIRCFAVIFIIIYHYMEQKNKTVLFSQGCICIINRQDDGNLHCSLRPLMFSCGDGSCFILKALWATAQRNPKNRDCLSLLLCQKHKRLRFSVFLWTIPTSYKMLNPYLFHRFKNPDLLQFYAELQCSWNYITY